MIFDSLIKTQFSPAVAMRVPGARIARMRSGVRGGHARWWRGARGARRAGSARRAAARRRRTPAACYSHRRAAAAVS